MQGVIVEGRGGLYTALDETGQTYILRAKKKFRRMGISPLVGDEIAFTPGTVSDEHGWVEEILPRRSSFVRPPVANVSLLCIVAAVMPQPDWLLVDKLLIFARQQGIRPLLLLNKTELDPDEALLRSAKQMYAGAEVEILPVSAKEKIGLETVKERLIGETCCFSGQSGVGKSSLLNALFALELETGEISQRIERGKNTTRHAAMLRLGETNVMDTPGFSLLEIEEPFDPVKLQESYPEFAEYIGECRFQPCFHASEPGCRVMEAVRNGRINQDRVARYHELLEDCRKKWRERYD